eukprot:m.69442 g.69442  ORF g.69442 m.69442 type:complete len:244 (-) comp18389_c0_seq1:77-808(-)
MQPFPDHASVTIYPSETPLLEPPEPRPPSPHTSSSNQATHNRLCLPRWMLKGPNLKLGTEISTCPGPPDHNFDRELLHRRRMAHPAYIVLLWVLAISVGVMAGVYFTFSAFVMTSLGKIEAFAGIAAMQSINRVIVTSAFLPLFFGSTLLSVAAVIVGGLRWGEQDARFAVAGGVVYFVGMFLCTLFFNVPLNDALEAVDAANPDAESVWVNYLTVWTRWNHLRTVASTAACGFFIAAIAETA